MKKIERIRMRSFCYGKIHKRMCDARNIRGCRLREACCEVLGLTVFDENVFARTVEKILTTDTESLVFHFYDGTVKTARIHYFSQDEKKYTDPHRKPFGYTWSQNGYVIVPKEAEAVQLVYQYYAEGWNITDISRELESKGYQSIRGRFSRHVVITVLDSDFYIGNRTIKGQFTESGMDEVIENDHAPIVSKELFDTVQKRRAVELKKQERRIATRRRIDNEKRNGHPSQRQ